MKNLQIAGVQISPGRNEYLEILVANLFDYTPVIIPIHVISGKKNGPVMFVSASIHGDEIIGTEIVKGLMEKEELLDVKGTLICVPIVNPFGYNNNTRYLPDRRDLNRCFPGSASGSLAARIADTFLNEIVYKCSHGIDIHSGATHRINYPQIRIDFTDTESLPLAQAFNAPIIINSPLRPGSLRKAAFDKGIRTILFEGGEALRFDEHSIEVAVQGILNVMAEIGMLNKKQMAPALDSIIVAHSSHWIRATHSGSLRALKKNGEFFKANELLGVISDPFGLRKHEIHSQEPGVIVGSITMPLVNKGSPLFHVATLEDIKLMDDTEDLNIVLDRDVDIENEDWFVR